MKSIDLRNEIHALMRKHRIQSVPCTLPLAAECQTPIELAGIAATSDLDLDRMRLAPGAFDPLPQHVPLYYKHDINQSAGTITQLTYAADGSLHVQATVTHPMAARCQTFSYAARIEDYSLHDTAGAFFYASINKAVLLELTLTENPSNPNCRVTRRGPEPPGVAFYSLLQKRIQVLQERLLPLLAPPREEQASMDVRPVRGPTSFRSLVEQLNAKGA